MTTEFVVGKRAVVQQSLNAADDIRTGTLVGLTGTMVHVSADSVDGWSGRIGLEFEDLEIGHSANGSGRVGKCWYIDRKHLQVLADPVFKSASAVLFPADAKARKEIPLASGVLDYFPSALIEVAKVSFEGNKQHNPGEPLHWARGKSMDQSDTTIRHFMERGTFDSDGIRHSAKLAWRALAILQLELEAEGAPVARGAKL